MRKGEVLIERETKMTPILTIEKKKRQLKQCDL